MVLKIIEHCPGEVTVLFKPNKRFFVILLSLLIPGMSLLAMEPAEPSFWSWAYIFKHNPVLAAALKSTSDAGDAVFETPWLNVAIKKVFQSALNSKKSHHHHHEHDDSSFIASHLADIMKTIIKVSSEEFKPGGNGSKTLQVVLESLTVAVHELVKKDGAGIKAFREALTRVQEELKNGELKKTIDEFFATLSEQMKEDGKIRAAMQALNTALQGEIDILGEAVKKSFVKHGNAAIDGLGEGFRKQVGLLMQETEQTITRTSVKIAGITVLTIAAAYGTKVLWNEVERRMKIPKLILESSEKSLWQKMRGFFVSPEHLPEMVFSPALSKRLSNIIATTRNIKRKIQEGHKNVKYRNLLLHGLPGTGKTMFGRILAKSSGMDYAMMSGASFAQFKDGQGITEMNKLFEWANNSTNGLLLFIDEAESFLGGRVSSDVTKESYHILNNFLNHTGTRSDKFMVVCATNHPKLLDSAMFRRLDDAVEVPLPQEEERAKILQMYRDTTLLDQSQNTLPFMESVQKSLSNEVIQDIAKQTENLSGGELAGIVNALVSDASITDDGLLTPDLVRNAVDLAIMKNHDFLKQFTQATLPEPEHA